MILAFLQRAEELQREGYYLVSDLAQFGLPTSIYAFRRMPADDDNTYEVNELNGFDWTDKRLLRCLQVRY